MFSMQESIWGQILATNSVHSFLTSPSCCPTVCFCCSASINQHLRPHYSCCSSSIMSCDITIGPFPAFMFVYGLMWLTAVSNMALVALPNYMYIFRMAVHVVQISLMYSFSNIWTPSAISCFVVLSLVLQHSAIISFPAFSSRLEFVANHHTTTVVGYAHCNLQASRARGASPSLSSIWLSYPSSPPWMQSKRESSSVDYPPLLYRRTTT